MLFLFNHNPRGKTMGISHSFSARSGCFLYPHLRPRRRVFPRLFQNPAEIR
jgi:hypothetical protein